MPSPLQLVSPERASKRQRQPDDDDLIEKKDAPTTDSSKPNISLSKPAAKKICQRAIKTSVPAVLQPPQQQEPSSVLSMATSQYQPKQLPIKNLDDLSWELPKIVQGIMMAVGWQETDYVLSKCLIVELQSFGVSCERWPPHIMETPLLYRGVRVGNKKHCFRVRVGSREGMVDYKAVKVWLLTKEEEKKEKEEDKELAEPFPVSMSPVVEFRAVEYQAPAIENLSGLTRELPRITDAILDVLSIQEQEQTYQSCLQIELERSNVSVVEEKRIDLSYKGEIIGYRRADLVLKLKSGEEAVIEIKTISAPLDDTHVAQLHYYMNALGIQDGFLINFPKDYLYGEPVFCERSTVLCLQGGIPGGDLLSKPFGTNEWEDLKTTVVTTHMQGKRMSLVAPCSLQNK